MASVAGGFIQEVNVGGWAAGNRGGVVGNRGGVGGIGGVGGGVIKRVV